MTPSGRHRDGGFSLLVLLVGVVIVGLVATVIVIGLLRRDDPPTVAACDADRAALLRAEQRFHADHGRFGTEDELVTAGLIDSPLALQDVTLVADSFQVVTSTACTGSTPGATSPVAVHLIVSSVPNTVAAGRLIDPPIAVTLTDDGGVVLADSTAEVTISLKAANGAKLSGTTTVRAVAGVAVFTDLAIDKAGSGYSFAAEALGSTATSPSQMTVNPGTPARLRFLASPLSANPGVEFPTQPVVEVEDVMGNVIENASDPIVLAITNDRGPSGARLTCDNSSVVPTAGVARFGGCQINEAGVDYSLTATSMQLATRSDTFAVIGPATRLVIVQQPSEAVAGDTLSTTVAVEDSAGNVVTDSDATVTLTVNQHSKSLTGTTSVAVVDGVATFADLTIATSATNYTLTMKAAGLKTTTSAVFDVTTGPAALLVFTRQPSRSGRAGKSWSTQPIVTVEDAFGNVVVTSVDEIALQLTPGYDNPSALLVCAVNPVVAVNGDARFAKCSIDQPGSGYTLTATTEGLSAVSAPLSIT